MNEIYLAKENTWFDEGTIVKLIDDYRDQKSVSNNNAYDAGLFEGYKDGKIDQELCTFDEFERVMENETI